MGTSGRTAEEPTEHGTAVTAERRAKRGDAARTVLGKQRRSDRDGVQRNEQHDWLLPREARYDKQHCSGRVERGLVQEHKRDQADGDQLWNLRDSGRHLGGKL